MYSPLYEMLWYNNKEKESIELLIVYTVSRSVQRVHAFAVCICTQPHEGLKDHSLRNCPRGMHLTRLYISVLCGCHFVDL